MKVLMINKFLRSVGGAETYMFQTGALLQKKGIGVEYFGMYHPDNIVGNRWDLYADPIDFSRKKPMSGIMNPLKVIYSKSADEKMGILLEKFRPDIVHINNFNYQLTPSVLEAAVRFRNGKDNPRIIYTAHDPQLVCPNHYMYIPRSRRTCGECLTGSYINCIKNRCIHDSIARSVLGAAEAAYWKKRKIYRHLDAIICPSEFIKCQLDTNPVLSEKIIVLRNFIRPPHIRKKEENHKKTEGGYILYFGRYSEEKGIRTLLDVCGELTYIPFVFAGSGPLEYLLDGLPNVKNVGFLQNEELDRLICGARFTVCPSECNENSPFSVIESIMNRTPVLGSDRGGIPELIEPGKTGWLFPAGNRDSLSRMIRRIWAGKEPEFLSVSCGNVSFNTADQYVKKLIQIYRP